MTIPYQEVCHQGCIFWWKISIFPAEWSYLTYTFCQKSWGLRNWNCHFIAVLRRNLEKIVFHTKNPKLYPQIKPFFAYLSRGGGYSKIFRIIHQCMSYLSYISLFLSVRIIYYFCFFLCLLYFSYIFHTMSFVRANSD